MFKSFKNAVSCPFAGPFRATLGGISFKNTPVIKQFNNNSFMLYKCLSLIKRNSTLLYAKMHFLSKNNARNDLEWLELSHPGKTVCKITQSFSFVPSIAWLHENSWAEFGLSFGTKQKRGAQESAQDGECSRLKRWSRKVGVSQSNGGGGRGNRAGGVDDGRPQGLRAKGRTCRCQGSKSARRHFESLSRVAGSAQSRYVHYRTQICLRNKEKK